jgi:hypothetical protein
MFFLCVKSIDNPSQVFAAITHFLTSQLCQIVSLTHSNDYLVFECIGHLTKFKLCLSPDMSHVIEDISKNVSGAFKIKCIFSHLERDKFQHHCVIRNSTFSGEFSSHCDWPLWKKILKGVCLNQWQLMWSQYCIYCRQVEFQDNFMRFTLSGSIDAWNFTIIICQGNVNIYKGNVVLPGLRLLLKQ